MLGKNYIHRYGLGWPRTTDAASLHLSCIRKGGQWKDSHGATVGGGMFHHMQEFMRIVWPDFLWQKGPYKNYWAEKILETWIEAQYLGLMGCASAGKSAAIAAIALTDWYAFPDCTTTIVTSTDLKSLERRIWGNIKDFHRKARAARDWIPGHLVEGKQMIIRDHRTEFEEGRNFKNGLMGCPTLKGSQFVGLGPFIGLHNKRVRLIADEANLCPRSYLDASSNLAKCEDFKMAALGNPNETTNAHGIICEPSQELGGWEGGMDQSPGTKVWKTRYPNGLCLQLPGSDCPNLKAPEGEEPPFPFLITRKQMEEDAVLWGTSDWHHQMFVEAKMPRGQGSHRVITRQECEKHGATLEVFWRDSNITKIASLDAAYRGVGGDRCVFTEVNFGREVESNVLLVSNNNMISQSQNVPQGRQILALVDQVVIPIDASIKGDTPEVQIVKFVKDACERRGISPENFFYDSGMRTSLVQQFSRDWDTGVQSIDCGSPPTDERVSLEIDMPCKDYYRKLITQLWFSVRLIIMSRQFRGMSKEVMWELAAREWKNTPGNKIEVETKEEMKLKTSRSPDLADGLCLAARGAIVRGFKIGRLLAPKTPNQEKWKDELRKKSREIWATGQLEFASS